MMYHMTKEEALALLHKLRQIRQNAGEAIAFLEHMFQLQHKEQREEPYNPDEYLERGFARTAIENATCDKGDLDNQS